MHTLATANRLPVRTPEGSYEIVLGKGLLGRVGTLAAQLDLGRKVVIASDSDVLPLYGQTVISSLWASGFEPCAVAMLAGEPYKTMASVDLFVQAFLDAGLDRSGWVLALGGGVVGDTAGFAASIYMRGVPLLQAPTTLLAMADSSIGGKVGVDYPGGKNLIGAFKQPKLVVAALDALSTLPQVEVRCGMAEIIKAGIIADPDLFAYLEETPAESIDYRRAVECALLVKRNIVEADPFERGERAYLNLGHTFGHAFETCTAYSRPHGVAVAQGMAVAFHLSAKLGMCDPHDIERLENVLARWDLPSHWGKPGLEDAAAPGRVYEAMLTDKKRRDGKTRLVLPKGIGSVMLVAEVPMQLIMESLEERQ